MKNKISLILSTKKGMIFSHLLLLSGILLFTFFAYSGIIRNEFVWDDIDFIFNWPEVKEFNLKNFLEGTSPNQHSHVYRPVRAMIYSISYLLFGSDPIFYHLIGISIHLVLVLLSYLIAYQISKSRICAGITALIFGIHPVHTEAVSFVSASFDLFGIAFMFASVYFYLKSYEKNKIIYLCLSLISLSLAIFSNELTFSTPFILFAYDLIFNKIRLGDKLSVYYRQFIFFIPLLAYFISRFLYIKLPVVESELNTNFFMNLLITSKMFLRYIISIFLPLDQKIIPVLFPGEKPFNVNNLFIDVYTLLSIAILLGLVFIIYKLRKKQPIISFSISFFLISLIPVSNIFPGRLLYAERYVYPGSLGAFLVVSYSVYILYQRLRENRKNLFSYSIILLVFVTSLILASKTWSRNQDWKDSETLWKKTITQSPNNAFGYNNLGVIYAEKGMLTDAISMYKKSLELLPNHPGVHENLGDIYMALKKIDLAIYEYKISIKLRPDNLNYHDKLISAYIQNKQRDKAIVALEEAIFKFPDNAGLYYKLGNLYLLTGEIKKGEGALVKGLNLNPNHAFSYNSLATIYLSRRDYQNALKILEKAVEIENIDESIYYNLGITYLNLGNINEAILAFKKSLEINPNFFQAREILNKTASESVK